MHSKFRSLPVVRVLHGNDIHRSIAMVPAGRPTDGLETGKKRRCHETKTTHHASENHIIRTLTGHTFQFKAIRALLIIIAFFEHYFTQQLRTTMSESFTNPGELCHDCASASLNKFIADWTHISITIF